MPLEASANQALACRNHQLTIQLGSLCSCNDYVTKRYSELRKELETEHWDASLNDRTAEHWESQYRGLQKQYKALEEELLNIQPCIPSISQDEDVQMGSTTSDEETLDRSNQPESLLTASVGAMSQTKLTRLERPENWPSHLVHLSAEAVIRIAAGHDDVDLSHEHEFRLAQRHNCVTGECLQTSGTDWRCMAALVKVNGLEAYALLDTGSTTISVTHDFARVAKLKVMQLDNPVLLQLGMVGSHSMINFGAWTQLELGPACDDDAYMDVVNID